MNDFYHHGSQPKKMVILLIGLQYLPSFGANFLRTDFTEHFFIKVSQLRLFYHEYLIFSMIARFKKKSMIR